jgi:glycosyltransferase involved in cell wall biosynthesis
MTCFNEAGSVRDSLNSLLGQLDDDYEVVVVDNFSTDGTMEKLREFESARVRAIQRRCSRGLGRQIAFENSTGDYVIANMDLDDVFLPVVRETVGGYHEKADGKLLAVFNSSSGREVADGWAQNMTIGPRTLLSSIGGWRDLNIYEDWDVWSRAGKVGAYRWSTRRFAANQSVHPENKRWAGDRLARRYERYSNRLQLGLAVFTPGERVGTSQRMAYLAARMSLPFKGRLEGQDPTFDSFKPDYFIGLTPEKGTLPQDQEKP